MSMAIIVAIRIFVNVVAPSLKLSMKTPRWIATLSTSAIDTVTNQVRCPICS